MTSIISRLDITQIFCDADDFCTYFERYWQAQPELPAISGERRSSSRMRLSEIMTIVIAFHGSGFRTFKDFYTLCVLPALARSFSQFGQLSSLCSTHAMVFDAFMLFLA